MKKDSETYQLIKESKIDRLLIMNPNYKREYLEKLNLISLNAFIEQTIIDIDRKKKQEKKELENECSD